MKGGVEELTLFLPPLRYLGSACLDVYL